MSRRSTRANETSNTKTLAEGEALNSRFDVISLIKKTYADAQEISDGNFAIPFDLGGRRAHPVFFLVEENQIWISSPFARTSSITDEDALNANRGYLCGIGKDETWFSVRHVLPFSNLDSDGLKSGLRFVLADAHEMNLELGLGDDL